MHGTFPVPQPPAALRPPLAPPSRRPLLAVVPAPSPSKPARECLECGGDVPASAQATAEFCCSACRSAWNNRRAVRGAQLYDLWMITRYERGLARLRGVWTIMCNLARAYRDSDQHLRAGRRSWRRIDAVMEGIPHAYSRQGDKR
jgi:hypothetical protein